MIPRSPGAAAAAPPVSLLPRIEARSRVERLGNGMTVCLLANRQAPIVTTALWYRAGTRDEPDGHGGLAHFLEHMMFKGSAGYGAGEIDRLTQRLGGSNNAFTSHDATVYYFNFARDHLQRALAVEADRMTGLTLDPDETESERRVILEEIAMYEAEPWDALDQRVQARLFDGHPYGRPVLGTAPELLATGGETLAGFHRAFYRPDNAVLVVAGDLEGDGEAALAAVEESFGSLPGRPGGSGNGAPPARPAAEPALFPRELVRVERRVGEVARLLLALPAPAAGSEDHALLALASELLASGRGSRLRRSLVDEGQLCSWVTAHLADSVDPGLFAVWAQVVGGADAAEAEARLTDGVAALAAGVSEEELERARRIALADWVFDHERIHQQALAAGSALALHGADLYRREMAAIEAATAADVERVARRWLDPGRGAVLGRSLPREAA